MRIGCVLNITASASIDAFARQHQPWLLNLQLLLPYSSNNLCGRLVPDRMPIPYEVVMADSKNQHYVAQRLQRAWADNRGQVKCWKWKGDKLVSFPTSPRNIMSGNHLYGSEFETQFGEIEAKAWPVLDKLLGPGIRSMNDKDRRDWAVFILAQLARAPDKVEWVQNMDFEEVLKKRQRRDAALTREAFRAELASAGYEWLDDKAKESRHARIAILMSNMKHPAFFVNWSRLDWGVLVAPRPLILLGDEPAIFYGDLRTKLSEVYLPISPTQVFCAFNPLLPGMIRTSPTPMEFVRRVNDHQVRQAHRFVIGQAEETFIARRLRKSPEPFVERYPMA